MDTIRRAESARQSLAFDLSLEKASAEKSAFLDYIKVLPEFDSLRSDPRYVALLQQMGLPQ